MAQGPQCEGPLEGEHGDGVGLGQENGFHFWALVSLPTK